MLASMAKNYNLEIAKNVFPEMYLIHKGIWRKAYLRKTNYNLKLYYLHYLVFFIYWKKLPPCFSEISGLIFPR